MGASTQLASGKQTLVESLAVVPPVASDSAVDPVPGGGQGALQATVARAGVAASGAGADARPGAAAGAAAASGPLSPPEVVDAVRYHTLQPQKYSKSVVADIQGAVGVAATGVMDGATVQAIAARQMAVNSKRQPRPPLTVDGKAGPRTLPILKPVGLATDKAVDSYAGDIQGMQPALDKADLSQRAAMLLAEINKQLGSAGVPPITKPAALGSDNGNFDASTWTMFMRESVLQDSRNAAATTYHEARHAEQAWRVARMLAGKKMSADRIAVEAKIDPAMAVQATQPPLVAPRSTEAVEAEGWHETDPKQAARSAKTRAARDRFIVLARAYKQDPSPENRARVSAAFDAFNEAHLQSYNNKPDEFDAVLRGRQGPRQARRRAHASTDARSSDRQSDRLDRNSDLLNAVIPNEDHALGTMDGTTAA